MWPYVILGRKELLKTDIAQHASVGSNIDDSQSSMTVPKTDVSRCERRYPPRATRAKHGENDPCPAPASELAEDDPFTRSDEEKKACEDTAENGKRDLSWSVWREGRKACSRPFHPLLPVCVESNGSLNVVQKVRFIEA